jgi:polyphosphate kinase 2 (PPK2 family)
VKSFLHVTPEEQMRRFEERQMTPWKQHKITSEDWRNREKRKDYEDAVVEMIEHTDTSFAPWTVVEAEDKRYGRVKVVETVCARLESAMKRLGMLAE